MEKEGQRHIRIDIAIERDNAGPFQRVKVEPLLRLVEGTPGRSYYPRWAIVEHHLSFSFSLSHIPFPPFLLPSSVVRVGVRVGP